jgi:pSer/pThr/pTyr-binding forkhead associated (FHA) protein
VGYAFSLDVRESPAAPRPTRPGHWLVLRGRRVALQDGENIIGRDPSAHVWLDAAGVSRRHARIVVDAGETKLEDLGSKNGTTVGDSRVTGSVAVTDGDRIVFGSTPCVYRSSSGASTETRSRGVPRTSHDERP